MRHTIVIVQSLVERSRCAAIKGVLNFLGMKSKRKFDSDVPKSLLFFPEVGSDIEDAYWWYEEKYSGQGDEFFRCFEQVYSRMTAHQRDYALRCGKMIE